jgi:cytochrome c oxidase assembly factor CtaG
VTQELGIAVAALAMVALPLRAVVRLRRRRRDLAPWSRVALAALAASIWFGALTALDEPADERLSAHMLQHILIGDVVPLLLALGVWHVPALYDRALESERLHAFEHGTFLVSGLLVWAVLLDPARRGLLPGWRRVGYALALLAASGILGNVLVLSYRPLYPAYGSLRDQDLAGLVMMVEQVLTLGGLALLTARRRLQHGDTPASGRHPLAV